MTPMIPSISADHKYSYAGAPVPGVNEILEAVGISDFSQIPAHIREGAMYFGRYLHDATHLDDLNDLDEASIKNVVIAGKSVEAYLEGWRKYRKDYKPEFKAIEQRLYSAKYRYSGTFDRVADQVIDIKTSVDTKTGADLQTAAYTQLWQENYPDQKIKKSRIIVHLKENDYKITEYKNNQDFNDFRACLSVYNIQKKRGIVDKR